MTASGWRSPALKILRGRIRALDLAFLLVSALSAATLLVEPAAAQGAGFAIGGSLAGLIGSSGPLVVWQFDQSSAQPVGPVKGLEAVPSNTGIGSLNSYLLDCAVSANGTQVYTTSADNFLEVFELTKQGPQFVATAKDPRVIDVGPGETAAGSVIFQSLDLSPDGQLLALCGTSYAGPKLTGAASGALWLMATATRAVTRLTADTRAFCASVSFCSTSMLVAAFLDADRSGGLVVYQRNVGNKWGPTKTGAPNPSYSSPAKIACQPPFVAVMRDFNPAAVVTYNVPSLGLISSRPLAKEPRALGVSLALDLARHNVVARTNTSVWVIPYNHTGGLSGYPANYPAPCSDCNYVPFGVHSIGITTSKYGDKAYMGGPNGQILVFDLALKPPKFLAHIAVGSPTFQNNIQTICLQR